MSLRKLFNEFLASCEDLVEAGCPAHQESDPSCNYCKLVSNMKTNLEGYYQSLEPSDNENQGRKQ